jgi:hypothetical protein
MTRKSHRLKSLKLMEIMGCFMTVKMISNHEGSSLAAPVYPRAVKDEPSWLESL